MATSTATLRLPGINGEVENYTISSTGARSTEYPKPESRVVFAAAHVVPDVYADINPTLDTAIDWEGTIAYRRYLWSLGLGVAEAMDTAQRGMGLDWASAQELIRRSVGEAKSCGGLVASGAGTDHLVPAPGVTIDAVIAAYEEQCAFVESVDGRIILMASRALAAAASSPDDYARVYGHILSQVKEPVIIHWLGEMFDPALAGYWGSDSHEQSMDTALAIISDHADKVDGIKISLLDEQKEIDMRRRLPEGVRMYSGDDFNYPTLIKGDDQGYSDALLGIFDAIAPAAAAAFAALDRGDIAEYDALFAPTVPLSRHIFTNPTRFYKTGVVFLAWLNGHQDHFRMVGGQESCRSLTHLTTLFRLADEANLFSDVDVVAARMRSYLEVSGVSQ